jgi:hypothetical protein
LPSAFLLFLVVVALILAMLWIDRVAAGKFFLEPTPNRLEYASGPVRNALSKVNN